MPVGAVVGGITAIGAVGSAVVQSNAADDAASAAERTAKLNNQLQTRIYDETTARYKPYVDAGYAALDPLLASYGLKGEQAQRDATNMFHSAPDYQFSLDEGRRGVEGSAAAKGGLYSGGAMRALQRYGSDYANNYLNTWRGGLQGLVNTGTGATGNAAQAGKSYADAYGANNDRATGARISAYGAQGDAWSGAIGDVAQAGSYALGRSNGWYSAGSGNSGGRG